VQQISVIDKPATVAAQQLSQGVYLVKVQTKEGRFSRKLILL